MAVAVAATPAQQHPFMAHHGLSDPASFGTPLHPARNATPSLVGDSKWSKVTTMAALPNFQLRIKKPQLCALNTTQYSGYLDTDEDRHFFFWFFEARNVKRKKAPILLWMNGGPGCSSSTGALMELGPCRVMEGGESTKDNAYGWNDKAHVIFLDQPLNVGYSYGKDVFDSTSAGKDVYSFLQLFYHSFPEYANSVLHIFGESYAGHYIPATAKAIHESNLAFSKKQEASLLSVAEQEKRVLPLASIGIGNGLTDPLIQYKYYSQMACNSTYPPVLKPEQCKEMDNSYPTCARLIEACYKWQNVLACYPAMMYCNSMMISFQRSGKNPYDVRRDCEGDNFCYPIMTDIDTFMNRPDVQAELGSDVKEFKSCSQKVYSGFTLSGDWMKPFHRMVPPLLEAGIKVLIYAGDADFICNWYGNKAWIMDLEWSGKAKFNQEADKLWFVDGAAGGEARTHGNLTFIRAFGGGHMYPYDQPESALDMVNRWISNKPFY
ncbi:hypothetical protein IWW39_001479 [Coemansia spiralis]|uniref:Carboxypeptidase n=1 Tax=Coemansia spiralis TaxID=417178 RepID=A0A9W8GQ15_9FUNG|nr:hypothetical protein IWW39_001479 [Coemansia spiralis]